MQASKRLSLRNRIVTIMMTLLAVLVMATPVLANSRSWSFLAYYDRYYINGKTNGVLHTMTAGALTLSGTIKTTAIYGTPAGAQPWYFEVWKNGVVSSKKCTAGPIAVPVSLNQTKSFTKACGTITAGQYYLVIWRAAADNREVTGSGTLKTP